MPPKADKQKAKTDRELLEESLTKINKLESTLELVRKNMESTLEKVESLQEELKCKDKKIDSLNEKVEKLEWRVEELEQRSRMGNIVIRGVKETRGENCMKLVEEIGNQIGIVNPQNDIQLCHRVSSRNKNMPRPIVVRLLNSRTRNDWVRKAKEGKTWKRKLFVHEHLTPNRQHLFHQSKELAKKVQFKFVWTKDCRVLMKKDDSGKTYVINSEKDLKNVLVNENGKPGSNTSDSNLSDIFD